MDTFLQSRTQKRFCHDTILWKTFSNFRVSHNWIIHIICFWCGIYGMEKPLTVAMVVAVAVAKSTERLWQLQWQLCSSVVHFSVAVTVVSIQAKAWRNFNNMRTRERESSCTMRQGGSRIRTCLRHIPLSLLHIRLIINSPVLLSRARARAFAFTMAQTRARRQFSIYIHIASRCCV